MLEEEFHKLYLMFRANYYRRFVREVGSKDGSLSATESYCVEMIHLLGNPTVTEFANYLGISTPNANYKINSLVKKGYIGQRIPETDRRERRLEVTDKFLGYYGLNDRIIANLMKQIREDFSEEEILVFENMLTRVLALMEKVEGGMADDEAL
ncbi:MAG: MarR family transcriptional regulator [Lachnospiraceae bacterium]|jgi:DNA-binding MarR family transcriptional regulator|nr:MarR family transcriptional regulator [Lachnospiraceae bacterium]